MFIEIVDVVREDKPSSNGKGTYGQLTVTYRSGGKIAEKKLMSFTNPAVFKHFEKAQKGENVDVTSVKNEKTGYWDWTAIGGGEASQAPSQQSSSNAATSSSTRVTGSNYETKEERAVKQRYIVRQSSLSVASQVLAVGAKGSPKSSEIISLAKEFESYVFSTEDKSALDMLVEEMGSDIPE